MGRLSTSFTQMLPKMHFALLSSLNQRSDLFLYTRTLPLISRFLLLSCSLSCFLFDSELKRRMKADQKAKEKAEKLAEKQKV